MNTATTTTYHNHRPTFRQRLSHLGKEDIVMLIALIAISLSMLVAIVLPLFGMFSKSFQNNNGDWVGLGNFIEYFSSPGLVGSIGNSIWVSLLTTVITGLAAFVYAYALTRSCMPGKKIFRALSSIPILAPSLLPAISLVYLLGNQGLIREILMGESVYGPIGIVIGMCFYIFPHILMIMITALSTSDGRLYEAAEVLGAGPVRIFFTVTLPGARYGLISAAFVAFTLAITDFGIPKVIGGNYNVLATDIYKQVVGQQNFSIGAVVGMVLLIPALVSFAVDRHVRKKQTAQMSARSEPYRPKPHKLRDGLLFAFCAMVALFLLTIIGTAAFSSLVTFWPYEMSLTLQHYDFNANDPNGWEPFFNSLTLSAVTAVIGTLMIFFGAYFVEKTKQFTLIRNLVQVMAMVPMAVPGMVLGLAYVFFFNAPGNPLNGIYGTMIILGLSTVAHFYTVSHLTLTTALKQIDGEFEAVSASLKAPFYKTVARVHFPICLPAISDVAIYLFVNSMTTVSAVVFLYAPDTKLASISVLNMDDVGDQAPAAAMAMMIVMTSIVVKTLHVFITKGINARTSAWKNASR